jgi:hypothetical protein
MIGEQTFEGRKENLAQAKKLSRKATSLARPPCCARHPHRHQPLALFVSNLNSNLSCMATREPIPSDLDGCEKGLPFSVIYIVELQTFLIGGEAGSFANVEIEARHGPA